MHSKHIIRRQLLLLPAEATTPFYTQGYYLERYCSICLELGVPGPFGVSSQFLQNFMFPFPLKKVYFNEIYDDKYKKGYRDYCFFFVKRMQ